jgi:hypothetical protein
MFKDAHPKRQGLTFRRNDSLAEELLLKAVAVENGEQAAAQNGSYAVLPESHSTNTITLTSGDRAWSMPTIRIGGVRPWLSAASVKGHFGHRC